MDASEVHYSLEPHYFNTILLGDATELRASKHCIQVDDKKDEDVVAVLLDEPAPEGQLKTQEIVYFKYNKIPFRLSANYEPTAHTDGVQFSFCDMK